MLVTAVSPPKTYSDWVAVLDMLKAKSDDEAVLYAMQKGTIEWQSGVAERFSKKLIDVINYRMNAASDRFQKEISHSNGQERVIVQALLALRRELRFFISGCQSSRNSRERTKTVLSAGNQSGR